MKRVAGVGGTYLDLKHFTPAEFVVAGEDWGPLMAVDTLYFLDAFRELWGASVTISPLKGSLGRRNTSNSGHNVNRWGEVRAADVFPKGLDRDDPESFKRAYSILREIGVTAFGIYPDWRPHAGLHIGSDPLRTAANPRTWAMVREKPGAPQVQVALADVMPASWRP